MHTLWILFQYECRRLLVSVSSYIVAGLFLLLMGFNYLLILFEYAHTPMDMASVGPLFETFWIPTLCVIPLLTMRTLSEECRSGMLETLLATPVRLRSIILGKFFSVYTFYLSLWVLTLLYPPMAQWTLKDFSPEAPFYTPCTVVGGFTFILLSSGLFIGAGILASALTRNSFVAGWTGFCLLFGLLIGGRWCGELPWLRLKNMGDYVNSFRHLEELSRGILDTRVLVFYIAGTLFFLVLTKMVLGLRDL
jgi:ABC-2 type transport system permease protein